MTLHDIVREKALPARRQVPRGLVVAWRAGEALLTTPDGRHCRGSGPHVRSCWVVDLILGRE